MGKAFEVKIQVQSGTFKSALETTLSRKTPFVVKDTECDVFVRRPGMEPYDATSLDIAVAFKSDVVSYSVCRKFWPRE